MALREFVRTPTPTTNTSLRAPAPFPSAPAPSYSPVADTRQLRTPAVAPYPGFTSGYNPIAPYSIYRADSGVQWSDSPYPRSIRGITPDQPPASPSPVASAPYNPGPVAPAPYNPGPTPYNPGQTPYNPGPVAAPAAASPYRPSPPSGTMPATPYPGTGTPATPATPNPGTWVPGTPGTPAIPAYAFEEWRNGERIKQSVLRQAQSAVAETPGRMTFPQLLSQLGR